MIRLKLWACLGLAAVIVAAVNLPAAAEGWPALTLNPFKSSDQPSKSNSGSNPLRLPDLTGRSSKKTVKTKEPSTWQKLSTGTKKALTKTKETLLPWTKKEDPNQSILERYTVNDLDYSPQPKKPKTGLASWLSSDDEEEDDGRPKTVTDFLKQPRPK